MITFYHLFTMRDSKRTKLALSVLLPDDATLEAAVRALKDAHLTAPVGTTAQYFNLNYAEILLPYLSG